MTVVIETARERQREELAQRDGDPRAAEVAELQAPPDLDDFSRPDVTAAT